MIGAITGGIGSIAGYFGQREANETNRQNMRDANRVTEAESRRNREFQREMSNTSHQREVADLEAAGLNPLLSATGGATTPGGASGSGTAGASMENTLGSIGTSAKDAVQIGLAIKKQKQEIKNLKQQEKKTHTETTLLKKDVPKSEIQNQFMQDFQKGYLKLRGAAESSAKALKKSYNIMTKETPKSSPTINLRKH